MLGEARVKEDGPVRERNAEAVAEMARGAETEELEVLRVPRTIGIYKLKSLVGRRVGVLPVHLRLVWETGEWDPAGKEDEDDEDVWGTDSDDDGEDSSKEGRSGKEAAGAENGESHERKGKWVKREVVLVEGTRPLGFWIEGKEADVRVEIQTKRIGD